ncbi:unnamed protein product [Lepeophtheirus salmonis]|uniref:(salmon louse) hypothetical protein n=1 Tax=Lepeophtheirus salmonis TaxID=72036 RepID=A0A817FA20_LEPSM|nr:unnamed protein product [Lepeophtheirus salmonis]CAG9476380.1 unnamed protein product [Lepeophtheirus salmonis]
MIQNRKEKRKTYITSYFFGMKDCSPFVPLISQVPNEKSYNHCCKNQHCDVELEIIWMYMKLIMKGFILAAFALVGITTFEASMIILEMKEKGTSAVEYLKQFGINDTHNTVYSKGPTTMEYIQLTEEG